MKSIATSLEGVLVIEPAVFGDERGWFYESWNRERFNAIVGRDVQFAQDNHSFSTRGILRGMHYQVSQPQGKLVRVVAGEVFDVAVDLRRSSPTFGSGRRAPVGAEPPHDVDPEGFAHGFIVLSDPRSSSTRRRTSTRPSTSARSSGATRRSASSGPSTASRCSSPRTQSARDSRTQRLSVIRALVTGGRGQVGSELLRALEGRARVIARDRASLDLADADAIRRCVRENAPSSSSMPAPIRRWTRPRPISTQPAR
jgi:dTDP-4-dehydrorhamnose 3,5-epimerase